jgi:hypothetical protein
MSRNVEALTLLDPSGPAWPVMGVLYLYLYLLTHAPTNMLLKNQFSLQIFRKKCKGFSKKFSGRSSTTNAHSETGQKAVCCQNLTLGALSSRSALSVLVGALFKKFFFFFEHALYQRAPSSICI